VAQRGGGRQRRPGWRKRGRREVGACGGDERLVVHSGDGRPVVETRVGGPWEAVNRCVHICSCRRSSMTAPRELDRGGTRQRRVVGAERRWTVVDGAEDRGGCDGSRSRWSGARARGGGGAEGARGGRAWLAGREIPALDVVVYHSPIVASNVRCYN
jgi:hypothetical protein